MNYKAILEKLGLVENVDFLIIDSHFQMKAKVRKVEITPAVVDENGVVISAAVMQEQSYLPDAPSEETLKHTEEEMALDEADVALLVSEYLADKAELRDIENDSLNIVNGRIYHWGFANIPQPTREQLLVLIAPTKAKYDQAKINAEALAYLAATDYFVVRRSETGADIPMDVLLARAAARSRIVH